MNIYEKLQKARLIIKTSDLKKAGHNEYSKYDYYTPEQVAKLVDDACKDVNIMHLFDLKRNEYGIFGILQIINLDDITEELTFEQSTDIPQITATNIAQQIGGAVTYTKRYMLMTAFDIVDNNLDFDTTEKPSSKKTSVKNSKGKEPENWLNIYTSKDKKEITQEFKDCHKAIHEGVDGKKFTVHDIRKKYKVSKAVAKELENEFFFTNDLPFD